MEHKQTVLLTLAFLGLLYGGIQANCVIDVDSDFYTPMGVFGAQNGQLPVDYKEYILTSNAYEPIPEMGLVETLSYFKFDLSNLPDNPVRTAWLRLESFGYNPEPGHIGWDTPVLISVDAVTADVNCLLNGDCTVAEFQDHNLGYIRDAISSKLVSIDGIYYWEITSLVNDWIAYLNSGGVEGRPNYGFALTGRSDPRPDGNQHPKFYSQRTTEGTVPVLIVSPASSDYDYPWQPDWSGEAGYTFQFWGLHDVNGSEPEQPLPPDNEVDNPYGDPSAVWESTGLDFCWSPYPAGKHPAWVDGVYGGLELWEPYGPHDLTITIPTGGEPGSLKVFLQYDWYNHGSVAATIPGAAEVTCANYHDYLIGISGSGHEWYRTSRAFALPENPGSITVTLTLAGAAPSVDSFSVTTAVDAAIPPGPVIYVGDLDRDGRVGLADFARFTNQWLEDTGSSRADFNFDGTVDLADLLCLCENWLKKTSF